ncbi:MAG: hypothetical protein SCH98_02595 [Deferrisomatales bacterium]|nr:hypothetical protein [Deferrisomatales bacterium]
MQQAESSLLPPVGAYQGDRVAKPMGESHDIGEAARPAWGEAFFLKPPEKLLLAFL